jgi:hypothetical protein
MSWADGRAWEKQVARSIILKHYRLRIVFDVAEILN